MKLAWDPNPEPTVGGYRLSYGTASQTYTTNLDFGKVTSGTVTGLQPGKTYFFALKAYDTTKAVFSPFSNEVSWTAPAP